MDFHARILAVDDRIGSVRVLTLDAPSFSYEAGQYVYVRTPAFDYRAYSIANAPRRDGVVVLHIRNSGHGFSQALCEMNVGDHVILKGPAGGMSVHAMTNRPVLALAGGTGVSPVLALFEQAIRKGYFEHGASLIYGVRTLEDYYCRPEIETLVSSGDIDFSLVLDPETPDQILGRKFADLSDHAVYMSGPPLMVQAVQPVLKALGAREEFIFFDDWTKP